MLLIVLVTVSSTQALGAAAVLVETWVFRRHTVPPGWDCLYAAGFDPVGSDLEKVQVIAHQAAALDKCAATRPVSYQGAIAALVLLAVAALVYWWLPALRDRRRRPVPVEAVDPDGTLTAELADLCARSGIRSRPRFHVDAARLTSGAAVHGRTGRYTVLLHGGLLVRRGTDPERFRAVVLHELAHIHHRDVDYAYATTALWRVYVLLALLPSLALDGLLLADALSGADSLRWRVFSRGTVADVVVGLLLAGLVHLARADLLRRRELQADLRAVACGAHPDTWDAAEPPRTVRPPLHRFLAALRTHPGWAERRRTLADADRVPGVGSLEMFLAGVATWLLYDSAASLPLPLSKTWEYSLWTTVVLVTPVLCLSLGLPIVRAALTARGRAGSGARAGLWLGCGLLLGAVTTEGRSRLAWVPPQPEYLVALLFIGAVPVVWFSQCLRLAVGLPGRRRRWTAAALCALVTGLLLAAGLQWWQLGGSRIALGAGDPGGAISALYDRRGPGLWQDYRFDLSALSFGMPLLTPLFGDALFGVAALLAWLVPLVLVLLQRPGFRLRRTLGAGLAGGLLSWAGLALMAYVLYPQRPAGLQERTAAYLAVHLWWSVVTVLAACLLTAGLVAAFSRRHWLPRALVAVPVVQLLGYAGAFALYSADGCLGPFNTVVDRCRRSHLQAGFDNSRAVVMVTLVDAVLGAACAAVVGAGTARAVRRLRRRPAEPVGTDAPLAQSARSGGAVASRRRAPSSSSPPPSRH
ncbi:M48 family metalloprotease [Kitasatospora saccharophila]|uniref:M48 family metalloprotease n=1 Tax=Kitasatospora saccharophila TaxID=407973 RepID=UPI00363E331C